MRSLRQETWIVLGFVGKACSPEACSCHRSEAPRASLPAEPACLAVQNGVRWHWPSQANRRWRLDRRSWNILDLFIRRGADPLLCLLTAQSDDSEQIDRHPVTDGPRRGSCILESRFFTKATGNLSQDVFQFQVGINVGGKGKWPEVNG